MIFYFSATGNSQNLARAIAQATLDKTTDIESIPPEPYTYELADGERLGFVFPTYFCTPPPIVMDFFRRLTIHTSSDYYGFIAVTYGSTFGATFSTAIRALLKSAITINASFGLKTVDTFLPMFSLPTGQELQELQKQAALQTQILSQLISDRAKGAFETKQTLPAVQSFFLKMLYHGMRKTKHFKTSEACTGCGLCQKHCPVSAIQIVAQRPKWTKNACLLCLRCLHHCPTSALDYDDMTAGKRRYSAPIDLSDSSDLSDSNA